MITEKNKKILTRHSIVTLVFVFLATGSFLFGKNVLSYTGDYNKAVNGSLSATEWNNLINDFVAIRTGGNVGIGTTLPNAKLEIFGVSGDINSNGVMRFNTNTGLNDVGFKMGGVAGAGIAGYLFIQGMHPGVANDGNLILNPGAGNVGIGAISPNDIFSIGNGGTAAPAGSSNTGHNFTNTYLSTDDYALANYGLVKTLVANATSSLASAIGLWGGTTGGNIWSLNSANVGVGTTTPTTAKLVVVGDIDLPNANAWRYIKNSGTNGGLRLGTNNGSGVYTDGIEISSGGAYVKLNHNTTVTGNLFATGNVGIGTITPVAKLDVSQNMSDYTSAFTAPHIKLRAANATDNTGFVGITYDASTAANYGWSNGSLRSSGGLSSFVWKYHNNNATGIEYMRITETGKVGIGTTIPNDIFSIANGGVAAPTGSSNTGHNYTSTYLSTDDYALANTGYVKSLINTATSTMVTIAKFVGATSVLVNGTNAASASSGYTAANGLCNAAFPGSHVCTSFELLNSINTATSPAIPANSTLWIFNGPPGFTWNSNDCNGRTSIVHVDYGTIWVKLASGDGFGSLEFCDTSRALACCK